MKDKKEKKHIVLGAIKENNDVYIILSGESLFMTKMQDIVWTAKERKRVIAIINSKTLKVEIIGRQREIEAILAGIGVGVPSMADAIQLVREVM